MEMIVKQGMISSDIPIISKDHVNSIPNGVYKVLRENSSNEIIYIALNSRDIKKKIDNGMFDGYLIGKRPLSYVWISNEFMENVIVE